MKTIEDRTFTEEDVEIDDCHFVRCRFVRCRLYYTGGHLMLTECFWDTPVIRLSGQALSIVQVLKNFGYTLDNPAGGGLEWLPEGPAGGPVN